MQRPCYKCGAWQMWYVGRREPWVEGRRNQHAPTSPHPACLHASNAQPSGTLGTDSLCGLSRRVARTRLSVPHLIRSTPTTTSEQAKNSIFSKKISDLFSKEVDAALAKDQSFHRNISIREDMFSVETPDSVFAASSRNDDDLSYMSKSFGIASEGKVSHSASTVKR